MKTLLGSIILVGLVFIAVAICGLFVKLVMSNLWLFIPIIALVIKLTMKELGE